MEITHITMMELISTIKSISKELDELYKNYVAEDCTGRAMVSIYNNMTKMTINGAYLIDASSEICAIHERIAKLLADLGSYNMIKEDINSKCKIKFKDLGSDQEIECTVTQFLAITSPKYKKFMLDYNRKLKKDYEDAKAAQAKIAQKVMSEDKISNYVNAKMASLHIIDDPDRSTYSKFAKEYQEANTFVILDPINIADRIDQKIAEIEAWFDSCSAKLAIFNATTKIWYSRDSDTGIINEWGIED